ncbi:alpha/beta hydrolase [Mycolicibacterium moriokaense]|jgi:pimeloyl-ACP methyl ester carboxylesterase|uniref:Hydrolase n=1 Tax=Mycolicibacterium moriokaense TaxID=39691 RepID=A0AAD1HAQ8_9MYCO|nr:alpha/beta fold hydrolase [Mycolicibacterium moriokaense]MCV7041838.1 alpha/beta fold hydrolase [Mycolicibacterium moriokaense]ORB20674.1 alpha/beta hydrolase [Mycolicibacterium moriokaense]BBX01376.1 hydrolase [Mycolicibacterium moriokaense]
MADSRFIHNGDARIHYLDSGGDDRGAPVVFVPGMTCVADDYAEILTLFGRRTVVIDLRGHGRSGAPAAGYDAPTLSTDIGAVVDAVTDGPVHVVTFSRGTTYALMWAIDNVERVRSIAIGDYVPEEKVLTPEISRRLLGGRWRGTPVSERLDEDAANKTFGAAQLRSLWEPLARQQLPLLAVRSSERFLVGDEQWSRYRMLFPDARLVEFNDSPHDIFRPDRGRYPRLVCEHIDRVDDGR